MAYNVDPKYPRIDWGGYIYTIGISHNGLFSIISLFRDGKDGQGFQTPTEPIAHFQSDGELQDKINQQYGGSYEAFLDFIIATANEQLSKLYPPVPTKPSEQVASDIQSKVKFDTSGSVLRLSR